MLNKELTLLQVVEILLLYSTVSNVFNVLENCLTFFNFYKRIY